jgi:hypothetical protein
MVYKTERKNLLGSLLHDLELVENVGFEALVVGESCTGQILLHSGVVLCRLAVLVSAQGVAA